MALAPLEEHGYSGKILKVDLSSASITSIPTRDYAGRFIGGRGLATKMYWDEVPPHISAFDAANPLIIATGPLGGFPGLSGSRWHIFGKSCATDPEQFSSCNLGGHWGAELKSAGYDGAVIRGKSDRPVYLLVQDGKADIRDASHLWGRGAVEVREILKAEYGDSARVMASGPAGDNLVPFASVLADNDASGGSGFGAVMGSKRLKAIAVRGNRRVAAARPRELQELTQYVRELNRGRKVVPMNAYASIPGVNEKSYACFGCIGGCYKTIADTSDGKRSKRFCHSGSFYQGRVRKYYGDLNDVAIQATRLCNQWGLESWALDELIMWMSKCRRAGILTDECTGIPLSRMGSLEFIETLVRKVALREGFGDTLAQGVVRAAQSVGGGAEELIADPLTGGKALLFDPRTYIVTGAIWATEPRAMRGELSELGSVVAHWSGWTQKGIPLSSLEVGQPSPLGAAFIQDPQAVKAAIEDCYVSSEVIRKIAARFWGSEVAADFSTYEGKARAARLIQDRFYAQECLGLCTVVWPNHHVRYSEDHVGDCTIESRLLSAVTAREVDAEELNQVGERVFNLQRAILAREGHRGRESDKLPDFCFTSPVVTEAYNPACIVPGKDGEVTSRKGATLDRGLFEGMMDEYYQLRGWDVATGLPTRAKLAEVGLEDVVRDLD